MDRNARLIWTIVALSTLALLLVCVALVAIGSIRR
jgi:hypothetical protein